MQGHLEGLGKLNTESRRSQRRLGSQCSGEAEAAFGVRTLPRLVTAYKAPCLDMAVKTVMLYRSCGVTRGDVVTGINTSAG